MTSRPGIGKSDTRRCLSGGMAGAWRIEAVHGGVYGMSRSHTPSTAAAAAAAALPLPSRASFGTQDLAT